MKYLILFILLAFTGRAQVSADSLPGVYAGLYYFANPSSGPWVITQDTLYVSNIDSVNCLVQSTDSINFGYNWYYFTNYYSCNSPEPSNFFMKFYNLDSVKIIDDNIAQPPPNPPVSFRFYGKRISGLNTGLHAHNFVRLKIYPNPCNQILMLSGDLPSAYLKILIFDLYGKQMRNEELIEENHAFHTNVKDLIDGVYILKIKTANGVPIEKLFIKKTDL
jgi:hypothetical protein